MRALTMTLTAGLIAILSGCGGETDGGGGGAGGSARGASPAEIEEFCEAQCESSTRCPDSDPPDTTCVSDCTTDLGPLAGNLRGDLVGHLAECFRTLECGTNDDVCTERALEAAGYDTEALASSPEVQACLEKQDECQDTDGSFSDDHCGTQLYLVASARDALARCFERPCDELPACLAPIFGE